MSDDTSTFFLMMAGLLLAFWIFILLPASMARARRRSALVWVLISLLISPVLSCLLLLLLGSGRGHRSRR